MGAPTTRELSRKSTAATTAVRPELETKISMLCPPGACDVLMMSIAAGLLTGLGELLLVEARRSLVSGEALGSLHLNPQGWWMVPLSCTLIFGIWGGLAAAAARLFRRPWFCSLGMLGLCWLTAYSWLLVYRGLSNTAYTVLSLGLALQAVPWVIRLAHGRSLRAQALKAMPFLLAACWFSIMGIRTWSRPRPGPATAAPAGSPNVLFIVLDTVRAESLSLYGYERPTSPRLTSLARQGVRFDQARSPAAWTLPAHASMFTGHWAYELSARIDRPLDDAQPTLAEYFAQRGYETAGFVANTMFGSEYFGLGRGFQHFVNDASGWIEFGRSSLLGRSLFQGLFPCLVARDRPGAIFLRKDAAEINHDFLSWLEQREDKRPFFAFLNYFDAHDPYIPPNDAPARFSNELMDDEELQMLREWHRLDKAREPASHVAQARDRYEECIAALDRELGRLFDMLALSGRLENTIVVVTSDHGEHFGEHGQFEHGRSLYSQVTRVPLVIVARGRVPQGLAVAEPASLADLPATLVDLAGFAEQAPFPGRSLARLWQRDPQDDPELEFLLCETVDDDSRDVSPTPPRALICKDKVYHRDRDGTERIYDLADSQEDSNLAASAELEPTLRRFRSKMKRLNARGTEPRTDHKRDP